MRSLRSPGIVLSRALILICLATALGSLLPGQAGEVKVAKSPQAKNLFDLKFDAASKGKRVLNFPKDYSLGEILLAPYPGAPESSILSGAAKGIVVVPAGKFVTLIPAARFYLNPAIIKTIPADGVDSLVLTAVSLDDSEDGLCDRALAHVGHLTGLIALSLDRSDATDKGAVYAKDLPNLQKFSAFQAAVEGQCFKQFGGLKQLRYVRLPSDSLKDANLVYLSKVPKLEHLSLCHTCISDEGIKGLAACRNLLSLDLADNPKITDRSLKVMSGFKKLLVLNLSGTSVTVDGIVQLKCLPLVHLRMPGSDYSPAQMAAIKKALPGVPIFFREGDVKPVDADTNRLFAPLR